MYSPQRIQLLTRKVLTRFLAFVCIHFYIMAFHDTSEHKEIAHSPQGRSESLKEFIFERVEL